MSPGGTDASLLELAVSFFIAVSVIMVVTMILRRRSGSQDLLGSQMRAMRERADAAESPVADDRPWADADADADAGADGADGDGAASFVTESRISDLSEMSPGAPASGDPVSSGFLDATAQPAGTPVDLGGQVDAMADAAAWIRIAGLVESGQRVQAVELISATMAISADEAELLVDGLTGEGGEPRST